MPDRPLSDRLDQLLDAMLGGSGAPEPLADPELTELAEIAAALRDLPDAQFKLNLKADLQRRASMNTPSPVAHVTPVRPGFRTITPYVMVRGAAEMIDFVKQVYGAQELFRGTGSAGGIHCELKIADSMLMIGGGGAWTGPEMPTGLHVYVDEVDAVFERALQAGGTALEPPGDRDYGDRDSALLDPFGNQWYIATPLGGKPRPQNLGAVTPYLHPRQAGKLIDFLKRAFVAEEISRYEAEGTIHHATLKIGDSLLEMGEAHGRYQPMPTAFYLYVDNCDRWYERAMAAGGTSIWAPADQPYGDRVGGVQDPFGNHWYVSTHIRDAPA